ncbi:uncharacterized protein A4U43_C03F13750 [Asparagus officinalis]|uniref:Uncharacterized protein n=1 Tax=Asparagus officinalis TaxID=4686 RepID=A0A5P1FCN3_ASPOF|nr:uncharacterized protein A4U43_C03F13750 [Asparagus officinalis]
MTSLRSAKSECYAIDPFTTVFDCTFDVGVVGFDEICFVESGAYLIEDDGDCGLDEFFRVGVVGLDDLGEAGLAGVRVVCGAADHFNGFGGGLDVAGGCSGGGGIWLGWSVYGGNNTATTRDDGGGWGAADSSAPAAAALHLRFLRIALIASAADDIVVGNGCDCVWCFPLSSSLVLLIGD